MLKFQPNTGSVVYCDFKGFIKPEIIKRRPVIVVARNRKNNRLVTVVPISATEPIPPEKYHIEMDVGFCSLHLNGVRSWAKCDLINTISIARLNMVKDTSSGTRYIPKITTTFLTAIKDAIKTAHHL